MPSLVVSISPPGFGIVFEDGVAGDRLPGSPETQFSVFGSYTHELTGGNTIVVDGGYAWQDDVYSRVGARGDSLTLDSYGRASLSVGYLTETWSVTGYVDNLFDDYSESSVFSTSLFNQTVASANVRYYRTNVLPPRSMGVRFSYTWE